MATLNLDAINAQLTTMINAMVKLQRTLEAEIRAQNAPAVVQVPADELAELRAAHKREKAATEKAPAVTSAKEAATTAKS